MGVHMNDRTHTRNEHHHDGGEPVDQNAELKIRGAGILERPKDEVNGRSRAHGV